MAQAAWPLYGSAETWPGASRSLQGRPCTLALRQDLLSEKFREPDVKAVSKVGVMSKLRDDSNDESWSVVQQDSRGEEAFTEKMKEWWFAMGVEKGSK